MFYYAYIYIRIYRFKMIVTKRSLFFFFFFSHSYRQHASFQILKRYSIYMLYLHISPSSPPSGMYSNGLLLAGIDKEGLNEGNDLLCIYEDLIGRNIVPTNKGDGGVFPSQAPSLREGVCVACDVNGRSGENDV